MHTAELPFIGRVLGVTLRCVVSLCFVIISYGWILPKTQPLLPVVTQGFTVKHSHLVQSFVRTTYFENYVSKPIIDYVFSITDRDPLHTRTIYNNLHYYYHGHGNVLYTHVSSCLCIVLVLTEWICAWGVNRHDHVPCNETMSTVRINMIITITIQVQPCCDITVINQCDQWNHADILMVNQCNHSDRMKNHYDRHNWSLQPWLEPDDTNHWRSLTLVWPICDSAWTMRQ